MKASDEEMDKKILIVDDEAQICAALKREIDWLKLPIEVMTTINPMYAMDLIEQNDFSMIVCDQRMPSISGIEIIQFCKKRKPYIIRVLMSAHDDMDLLIHNFNQQNIDYFISKPWFRKDVHQIIDRMLNSKL
ncbi:response regulator [Fusibacter ferrireducens]|uniref:Stage 0 sporulation protein A homolog n=1 Tax=Fusibacter ferrireducens TaxID=2785058 RepID=A0ABR9ZQH9_9FIRM|nr:response regulator [Fusibacter ferrireducens]MBF4692722.1 response regulator [Fusibacter ferrireducens]